MTHLYEVEVTKDMGPVEFIKIEARNSSSAAAKARKLGWYVRSVNMIG